MTIIIANRHTPLEKIQKKHGDAHIIDLTSRASEPWVRFSPFYPHGNIPVPFSPDITSASVEGIWQGLKVFETMDVDTAKFAITTMKSIKRSVRKYGRVLGHRNGVHGEQLLPYIEARRQIYLPSYRWVLDHYLTDQLNELARLEAEKLVVLLDYETNCDLNDTSHPLSHAGLVQRYLAGNWPEF